MQAKKYFQKLITLTIGIAIAAGIPYLLGKWWLLGSWLPALYSMAYLDGEDK